MTPDTGHLTAESSGLILKTDHTIIKFFFAGWCSRWVVSVVINGDKTIFIGTLDQAAKKLNIKVKSVPHRITHNIDFKLTTTGEWRVTVTEDILGSINIKVAASQNLKEIDIVAEYKNKNYAFVKLTGDGWHPQSWKAWCLPKLTTPCPTTSWRARWRARQISTWSPWSGKWTSPNQLSSQQLPPP